MTTTLPEGTGVATPVRRRAVQAARSRGDGWADVRRLGRYPRTRAFPRHQTPLPSRGADGVAMSEAESAWSARSTARQVGACSVRHATTVGTSTGRQVRLDLAADVGEPAPFVEETPITSGGGQSSTIQCSSTQRIPAPGRHATPTAAVAGRRAGRAAVGARRPVWRHRSTAPPGTLPSRPTCTSGAPCPRTSRRTLRCPTRSVGSSRTPSILTIRRPAPSRPTRSSPGGSSSKQPMRSRRAPRRADGSSCWPTSPA